MVSTNSEITLYSTAIQAVPLHVDAATGAKRVEAVEDPVTGHLDTPHWKDKVMFKAEILVRFLSETAKDTEQESG